MRYPAHQMTKAKRIRGPLHTEPSPRTERDIRYKLAPPQLEEIMNISSRGTPVQGDPYKKYLSKGQEALVHSLGARFQPTNLLLKFQLKTGTTSSWEPVRYKTRNYSLGSQ
jgi:hypothetical protein